MSRTLPFTALVRSSFEQRGCAAIVQIDLQPSVVAGSSECGLCLEQDALVRGEDDLTLQRILGKTTR